MFAAWVYVNWFGLSFFVGDLFFSLAGFSCNDFRGGDGSSLHCSEA